MGDVLDLKMRETIQYRLLKRKEIYYLSSKYEDFSFTNGKDVALWDLLL